MLAQHHLVVEDITEAVPDSRISHMRVCKSATVCVCVCVCVCVLLLKIEYKEPRHSRCLMTKPVLREALPILAPNKCNVIQACKCHTCVPTQMLTERPQARKTTSLFIFFSTRITPPMSPAAKAPVQTPSAYAKQHSGLGVHASRPVCTT